MKTKQKVYAVGIGPGDLEHMTIKAYEAIKKSEVIVGYKTYIKLIEPLIKNKEVISLGMKREVDRCKKALEYASKGKTVSIVSSGDVGIYGMAGILLEIANKDGYLDKIDIEVVPGVTASSASASSLGAPIMHDYISISLSDLLTDWDLIQKRLHCAGEGDFVVCIYNPKSKGRKEHIKKSRDILLKYKEKNTKVGIVKNAKRDGESLQITTLEDMLNYEIDMFTTIIIGNSMTYKIMDELNNKERLITPRGYNLGDVNYDMDDSRHKGC